MSADHQPHALAERLLAGDRQALSRAMSVVENGEADSADLLRRLARARPRQAAVVGVTGPPGAGKSTLVGRLAGAWVAAGRRVGVLLVDPSSPLSGGAVLADRVRMARDLRSERLFTRSLAARGQAGGLSGTTSLLVRVLDAWGAELIVVETVGAGQGEIEICRLAHVTVVVAPPGLGDELQAMKAGLMELADLFVVNKADRPGAGAAMANLGDAGAGGSRRGPRRVLATVATTGDGIAGLVEELDRLLAQPPTAPVEPAAADRRLLLAVAAGHLVRDRILASTAPEIDVLAAASEGGAQVAARAAGLVT